MAERALFFAAGSGALSATDTNLISISGRKGAFFAAGSGALSATDANRLARKISLILAVRHYSDR